MMTLKHLLIACLLAIFAISSIASTALAACNCAMMSDQAQQSDNAMSDAPCHEMGKTTQDATGSDANKADCESCGCGHCNIVTSMALPNLFTSPDYVSAHTMRSLRILNAESFMLYTIDHPPKSIS